MLRSNLSTRPFYNERGVRAALAAVGLLAVALTLYNVYQVLSLQGQSRDARQTIAQNEAQARDLQEKARVVRRSIDRARLDAVQLAAQEANALIERRTFSWTELLNQFQATLPADVRIAGVSPAIDQGRLLLTISVLSRRVEEVEAFMDALEKTGAFSGVLSRSDTPDGEDLRSELQAYYRPLAAAAPPAASESGKPPSANQSAAGAASPGEPR